MSTNIYNTSRGGNASTTKAVEASLGADAEFLDARGIEARFGIKRSLLYVLLHDGSIRGVSLRRRGQLRGKRLFNVDSVRQFLLAEMHRSHAEDTQCQSSSGNELDIY